MKDNPNHEAPTAADRLAFDFYFEDGRPTARYYDDLRAGGIEPEVHAAVQRYLDAHPEALDAFDFGTAPLDSEWEAAAVAMEKRISGPSIRERLGQIQQRIAELLAGAPPAPSFARGSRGTSASAAPSAPRNRTVEELSRLRETLRTEPTEAGWKRLATLSFAHLERQEQRIADLERRLAAQDGRWDEFRALMSELSEMSESEEER